MIQALYIIYAILLVVLIVFYLVKAKGDKIESGRLKRRIQHLEELDHTKQVFLASMAHQLKTPLAGIKWALDLLQKEGIEKNPSLLADSQQKIEEMFSKISDLLKTSAFDTEKGQIKIKKEDLDLKSLVANIVHDLTYLKLANNIDVKYEQLDSVTVSGDEKMLHMALANIFDNAFRYSPRGEIKISLLVNQKEAVLAVEDNGVGIDSNDLEFITFQKFYRGKNAMKIDPNESGVGLYATRKIIELHGGRMAISSVLGKGTKVSVTLPISA